MHTNAGFGLSYIVVFCTRNERNVRTNIRRNSKSVNRISQEKNTKKHPQT